ISEDEPLQEEVFSAVADLAGMNGMAALVEQLEGNIENREERRKAISEAEKVYESDQTAGIARMVDCCRRFENSGTPGRKLAAWLNQFAEREYEAFEEIDGIKQMLVPVENLDGGELQQALGDFGRKNSAWRLVNTGDGFYSQRQHSAALINWADAHLKAKGFGFDSLAEKAADRWDDVAKKEIDSDLQGISLEDVQQLEKAWGKDWEKLADARSEYLEEFKANVFGRRAKIEADRKRWEKEIQPHIANVQFKVALKKCCDWLEEEPGNPEVLYRLREEKSFLKTLSTDLRQSGTPERRRAVADGDTLSRMEILDEENHIPYASLFVAEYKYKEGDTSLAAMSAGERAAESGLVAGKALYAKMLARRAAGGGETRNADYAMSFKLCEELLAGSFMLKPIAELDLEEIWAAEQARILISRMALRRLAFPGVPDYLRKPYAENKAKMQKVLPPNPKSDMDRELDTRLLYAAFKGQFLDEHFIAENNYLERSKVLESGLISYDAAELKFNRPAQVFRGQIFEEYLYILYKRNRMTELRERARQGAEEGEMCGVQEGTKYGWAYYWHAHTGAKETEKWLQYAKIADPNNEQLIAAIENFQRKQ
ncbi:MAG: hypothetical protein AAF514_05565, partial [Verrucomicrobiota bacterium]